MIGKNRKGQGALEYLIIIAGVLAIAALVVMFISTTGGGASKQNLVRTCQNAASQCKSARLTNANYDCSVMCAKACSDPSRPDANGYPTDIMDPSVSYNPDNLNSNPGTKDDPAIDLSYGTAAYYCNQGITGMIKYVSGTTTSTTSTS